MGLSCIVSEIKRDIGRNRDFSYTLAFEAPVRGAPFGTENWDGVATLIKV